MPRSDIDVHPKDETELCEILSEAQDPVRISGGDTRSDFSIDGNGLSTLGLSGIVDYVPGALTMVARTGTPLSEIQSVLAAEGQQLAFEPSDYKSVLNRSGTSTIGGVFATNSSGARRIQCGAARDFLLGVRFVDGQGKLIKNGGRVMKNVTGYDLVKLMAGSWGTLGVMSEVSFKVLPAPGKTASLLLETRNHNVAVAAMAAALGSPYDVSGAAYLPGSGACMIRVEGFEKSVAHRLNGLQGRLKEFGKIELLYDQEAKSRWEDLRCLSPFCDVSGDLWRISVKPSDGPQVYEKAAFTKGFYDWAGGLIWGIAEPDVDPRLALNGVGGHATRVRGAAREIAKFHPPSKAIAAINAAIRKRFDPKGILNRGLMG